MSKLRSELEPSAPQSVATQPENLVSEVKQEMPAGLIAAVRYASDENVDQAMEKIFAWHHRLFAELAK